MKNEFEESGFIPPQAVEFEEAVLGAIMLEKDAIMNVVGILKPAMFYKSSHQKIYSAILELYSENNPIDLLTVTQKLKKKDELEDVGGAYAITQLTSAVASSSNIEYHSRILSEKYMLRECIGIADTIKKSAYANGTDVFGLLAQVEGAVFNLSQAGYTKEHSFYHENINTVVEKIEKLKNQEIKLLGLPSGYTELDRITKGWQNTDLIIMAARPGMGKTTEALNFAYNASKNFGKKVAIFSLEMGEEQLTQKLLSLQTETFLETMKDGTLNDFYMQKLKDSAPQAPKGIIIDDTPSLSIFELRSKARRLKQQQGIDMIIIDYLQLMTCELKNNSNREQEISTISRSLKALAKELKIPIMALSQLSRDVEKRGGLKKPILSDLRESGAIEQDADIVMFLWRPHYYKQEFVEYRGAWYNTNEHDIVMIDIAKHRNGRTAEILQIFHREKSKFTDFDTETIMQTSAPSKKSDKPF